jgi:hypothetical protein
VRTARLEVAALNAGPLTRPTPFDRVFWTHSGALHIDPQHQQVEMWRQRTWQHGDDGVNWCDCRTCTDLDGSPDASAVA